MDLNYLLAADQISIRSYNICKRSNINTIREIIEYFLEHSTFLTIDKCGEKSNSELIGVATRYLSADEVSFINSHTEIAPYGTLSRIERQIINDFIAINTSYLSARSKNALTAVLSNNFNVLALYSKIFEIPNFDIGQIKNVGALSKVEIESYISSVRAFINQVSSCEHEEDLSHLKTKYFLQKTFDLKNVPKKIVESQSAFVLVDFLMTRNNLFKESYQAIIDGLFYFYKDSKGNTLEEVSKCLNFSKERIRQLRNDVFEQISSKLSILSVFGEKFIHNYEIDVNQIHIHIPNTVVHHINDYSNTNFSKPFIIYILSKLLSETHQTVGNVEDALWFKISKNRTRYNWKSIYLIAKGFAYKDEIEKLMNDISRRLNDRIEETYRFNFYSYISRFVDCGDEKLSSVAAFCEKIINEELNLFVNPEDDIVFERNTLRPVPELAVEILEELGEPSKLDVIYHALIKKYPHSTKNLSSLRGAMTLDSFIFFGRSSTYGLQKWEGNGIKGGTIKDMVMEYLLLNNSRPIHIYEIYEYVSKFRKTKPVNISANLDVDPSKSFKFYKCGFIGLKSLKNSYDEEKYNLLPTHLIKKLIAMINTQKIKNANDWIDFLSCSYRLSERESMAMLSMLKFRNKNIHIK